jgi:hypothetical protein
MSEEKLEQSPAPNQAGQVAEFLNSLLGELLERKNIRSVYANNTQFHNSDLDFTILFGQLNRSPSGGKTAIDWTTAVTMAWAQAKMLSYYLRVNLAIYEAIHEVIKVPAGMLPATITAPNDLETNPVSKKVFEAAQKIRQELMDEQLPLWPSAK